MTEPEVESIDTVTCLGGDANVRSGASGQIVSGGDHGLFVRDTRFLDELRVLVDGRRPRPLAGGGITPSSAEFYADVSPVEGIDPDLHVIRRRVVQGSLREEIDLRNRTSREVTVSVEVLVGTDFAFIADVKAGRVGERAFPEPIRSGLRFVRPGGVERTDIVADPPPIVEGSALRFELELPPRDDSTIRLDICITDEESTERPGPAADPSSVSAPPLFAADTLYCSDRRFRELVAVGAADLRALELRDPEHPEDRFFAAGSPWFLTLFGRDSLWTAFMALPYAMEVVEGTLRALARRQGREIDPETEEAPGKIIHEVRRGALVDHHSLPPRYYGTVDATPLFVILASEAWRWGLDPETVEELMPNIEGALGWMRDHGDPDGDGFLEYVRHGRRGLDNQGWKDSHDGIRFADGAIAQAPMALSEVQGYAYDAAMRGAELLERFGRTGADAWRTWAAQLAERFRERFWVENDEGRFPAVALDGEGRAVDAVASNMGHLLMSGILNEQEAALVADRLGDPAMASGWGLRTMATSTGGYNPLSYHGGSVWPHDTAIAVWGLSTVRRSAEATRLLRGLVRAGPFFRYRLPELFAGYEHRPGGFPVPYPSACRPQAWAAAAGLLLLRACLGVHPHVPDGVCHLRPIWPPPFHRLELRGLPAGVGTIDVVVDEDRGVEVEAASSLDVHVDG